MKILRNILLILVMTIGIFCIMPQNISRAEKLETIFGNITPETNEALTQIEKTGGIKDTIKKILAFLQISSGLIATATIAITGFEYIIGTPEIKDEVKRRLFPIVLSLVLIFGAVSIAKFIITATGG